MKEEQAIKTFNNYINAIETFGTIDPKCCNNLYEPAIMLLNLIETQKAELEKYKKENHNLKEKLQMYIPRRRVRRVYKMIGKILRTDISPELLEKELKKELVEGEKKDGRN